MGLPKNFGFLTISHHAGPMRAGGCDARSFVDQPGVVPNAGEIGLDSSVVSQNPSYRIVILILRFIKTTI